MSDTDTHSDDLSRADAVRAAILEAALAEAPFEGWNDAMLARAADHAGHGEGDIALYLPGGVIDLLAFWSESADASAEAAIRESAQPMKIREKITRAVLLRLEQYAGEEDAADRARARLLLPDAAARGARLLWSTSDMIWRAIGDTSTDGNFYSKRTILSGVYASTLAMFLRENDPAKPNTKAFLDRRIQNVMEFEKVKAQARKLTCRLPNLVELAARARYGARGRSL